RGREGHRPAGDAAAGEEVRGLPPAAPSAAEFAVIDLVPAVRTPLGKRIEFEIRFTRRRDARLAIGARDRFIDPWFQAGAVPDDVVDLDALRRDGRVQLRERRFG